MEISDLKPLYLTNDDIQGVLKKDLPRVSEMLRMQSTESLQ